MRPEVRHISMSYEDLSDAFSLVLEYGRLARTHWNSQPPGNYDQDLYVLKIYGYQGYFGITPPT
jgi:hypothetical protein